MPSTTRAEPPLRKRAIAGLIAIGLSAACALAPSMARADERDAGLHYKVYVGGFHVVDLDIDMGLRPERYRFEARLKTVGMVGSMLPWSMKAHSKGAFEAGRVVPAAAGQSNNWKGSERFIEMRFAGGLPSVEKIQPLPKADDRDAVPDELRQGALDLASAILAIVTRMEGGTPCDATIPVFDGRRRFDLVVTPNGADKVRANRYSPYEGPVESCEVALDRKAGFKRRDEDSWQGAGSTAEVWMGRAFPELPPVPVRLTFDTRFGTLIAHLNHASYRSGTQQAVLSHSTVRRAGMP